MHKIECRGDERKRALLKEHNLREFLVVKMPNVKGVDGCCGPVSEVFHFYRVTAKESDLDEFLVMGPGCAKVLSAMAGIETPKRFTPETAFISGNPLPAFYHNMAPLNQQLHDAIFLLCIAWRTVPMGRFLEVLDLIYRRPSQPVPDRYCKLFFSILAKDRRGRELAQIMADLRKVWPELRWFEFKELQSKVEAA